MKKVEKKNMRSCLVDDRCNVGRCAFVAVRCATIKM